jgi:hypothetical protein
MALKPSGLQPDDQDDQFGFSTTRSNDVRRQTRDKRPAISAKVVMGRSTAHLACMYSAS